MTDPAGTPEIRLTDLTKQFRDVRAVERVSLDIRTGELFSMLGPSGCGKTTTLRMIGGFELPSAGRIELRGRDVTTDPPDKRPVNMVFQNYALFPHLDVAENIAFGLRRRRVEKTEIKRRVAFRDVTVPLILPAVLAGAMLAFALSLDDLVVTSFNAGVGSTTLPIFIYCSIKFGGHAPDQRDLVDHRGGRLDRPVHRVAPRRVPHESRPARRRGRPGGLTLEKSVSPAGPASSGR